MTDLEGSLEKIAHYRNELLESDVDVSLVANAIVQDFVCRVFEIDVDKYIIKEFGSKVNDRKMVEDHIKNYIKTRHRGFVQLYHKYELDHVRIEDSRCYCYYKQIQIRTL